MPLYEYECDACGGRFEVIQKFSDTLEECRRCGKGPVRRLLSSPAIQFKGTGWYVTDYAQKGKSGGDGASGEKSSSSSDSKTASTSGSSASSSGSSETTTAATKSAKE